MKIQEIFDLSLKMGIDADPRDNKLVEKHIRKLLKSYKKLSDKKKKLYPRKNLNNPYPDSSIHNSDPEKEIKKILVTIDADNGTVLLAKELGVDLIINHHPIGKCLALLGDIMPLHVDVYKKYGVPVNIAEGVMRSWIEEVKRSTHVSNTYVTLDAAKLLDVGLINIHTPADNLVHDYLDKEFSKNEKKLEYVKDVLSLLNKIPEYQESARRGSSPRLFTGSPNNYCGKIITTMTGGTGEANKIYPHLANFGIGTVVTMHQREPNKKQAEKSYINTVIASHIASDSLGMNLFIDELEKKGIEIIPAGGFIRVSRIKNKEGEVLNPIN